MWAGRNQLQFHNAWGCSTLLLWSTGKRFTSLVGHEVMAKDWLPPFLCDECWICWGGGGCTAVGGRWKQKEGRDTSTGVAQPLSLWQFPYPVLEIWQDHLLCFSKGASEALMKAPVQLGGFFFLLWAPWSEEHVCVTEAAGDKRGLSAWRECFRNKSSPLAVPPYTVAVYTLKLQMPCAEALLLC